MRGLLGGIALREEGVSRLLCPEDVFFLLKVVSAGLISCVGGWDVCELRFVEDVDGLGVFTAHEVFLLDIIIAGDGLSVQSVVLLIRIVLLVASAAVSHLGVSGVIVIFIYLKCAICFLFTN